jgi:hypothetical protein
VARNVVWTTPCGARTELGCALLPPGTDGGVFPQVAACNLQASPDYAEAAEQGGVVRTRSHRLCIKRLELRRDESAARGATFAELWACFPCGVSWG